MVEVKSTVLDFSEIAYRFNQKQKYKYFQFANQLKRKDSSLEVNLELIIFAKMSQKKLRFNRYKIF